MVLRKTVFEDRLFSGAVAVSLVVHGILLLALPGLRLPEAMDASEWLEVEILPVSELPVTTLPESPHGSGAEDGTGDMDPIGESPLFPSPPLWLPDRLKPVDTQPAPMRLTIPTDYLPDIAGTGLTVPGSLLGRETLDSATERFEPVGQSPPELAWKPSRTLFTRNENAEVHEMLVSGEVANRKVIFRPPPPRPVTPVSGMVTLKFWVEPDGTIGRIVPVTRTNPELERIAMEYIEKWRFESVSETVGVQSGTIPVRFRIR